MSKPMVDLNGTKFEYRNIGHENPIYTVYAKNEKQAYKRLTDFLKKIGRLSSLENLELVK